jgi:ribosome-binding protein aMBF1 (putative translation factor)
MTHSHASTLLDPAARDDARQAAFGEVVRRHREALGWSRQRLADEICWRHDTIRRLESGRDTRMRSAYRIADALGVSLILLLADVENVLKEQGGAVR